MVLRSKGTWREGNSEHQLEFLLGSSRRGLYHDPELGPDLTLRSVLGIGDAAAPCSWLDFWLDVGILPKRDCRWTGTLPTIDNRTIAGAVVGAVGGDDESDQPVAALGDGVDYAEQVIDAMKPGGPLSDSGHGKPLGRKQKAIRRTLLAWISALTSQRLPKGGVPDCVVSSFTHLYGDKCFCGNRCTGGPFKCRRCTPTYGKGDFVKGLPRVDESLYGTGCRRPGFDPEKHSRSDYTVQPKDPPESSKLVWALRSVCHYDLLRPDAHVGRTDFDAIYEQQQEANARTAAARRSSQGTGRGQSRGGQGSTRSGRRKSDVRGGSSGRGNGIGEVTCYNCDRPGHYASDCPEGAKSSEERMKTSTCNNCGRIGHWARDCRSKRQPVGSIHTQPGGFALVAAIQNGVNRSDFGVSNAHINQSTGKLLPTWKTAPATAVGDSGNNRSAQAGEIVAAVREELGPGQGADLTPRQICDLEHKHGVALKWNPTVKTSTYPRGVRGAFVAALVCDGEPPSPCSVEGCQHDHSRLDGACPNSRQS